MNILKNIKRQYDAAGGYKEFLGIAVPLIFSTGIGAVQLFTDRTFLSWYSQESFAASSPAGTVTWAIMCFFFGTLSYINVFVAQYYGKKEYRSIGPAIWQSIYLAFAAGLIVLFISFFSKAIFMNVGHPYLVACEEVDFFRVLCYGAFPCVAEGAFAGFYSGRGKTRVVFLASLCGVVLNVVLDYCLIFGKFGFPEMGISGAALATNISLIAGCIIYVLLIMSKKNNAIYNTRCFKPDFSFMRRLLRYGMPSGADFFFDTAGFGIFMIIIGNLNRPELAASNIVSIVNHVFIMPIVGCGIATSIMVGNYLGKNKASLAQVSVRSSAYIVYTYVAFVVAILVFFPNQLIYPFSGGAQVDLIENIKPMVVHLLIILAAYIVFDAGNIIFASALKGAGDTMFVMKRLLLFSISFVVLPTYINVALLKQGVYVAWGFLLLPVIALAGSFYFRYKSNKWKKMRVIEMDIFDN
ncbi:MAG: MATE family efflux transporter [Endomicrobium sp.]|nr:MATE family efflux transporter [Endomicrobium sp.]